MLQFFFSFLSQFIIKIYFNTLCIHNVLILHYKTKPKILIQKKKLWLNFHWIKTCQIIIQHSTLSSCKKTKQKKSYYTYWYLLLCFEKKLSHVFIFCILLSQKRSTFFYSHRFKYKMTNVFIIILCNFIISHETYIICELVLKKRNQLSLL